MTKFASLKKVHTKIIMVKRNLELTENTHAEVLHKEHFWRTAFFTIKMMEN